MAVQVYILSPNQNSETAKSLARLFVDDLFSVRILSINNQSYLSKNKHDTESYRIIKTLKKSNPRIPTLIIKDNSITVATSESVTQIVKEVLNQSGWDLCYFTKWLDRCDLYINHKRVKNSNSFIVKTSSPHGLQALMFSPRGKKVILGTTRMRISGHFSVNNNLSNSINKEIEKGNIIALCVTPNVFEYNVLRAKNSSDLAKMSECRRPGVNSNKKSIPGTGPLFWFIATIFIIILILWSLYNLNPNSEKEVKS